MSDAIKLISQLIAELPPEKRALLADLVHPAPEPIAIIGVGCRFPGGADTPDLFWQFLENGGDGIIEVPRDRWDIDAFYDPNPSAPGKMNTRWGGFLSEVDTFDASFFGIAPREAAAMDPQQRLLLEVAWESLESAGQTLDMVSGGQIGVFIGVFMNDYANMLMANPSKIRSYDGLNITQSLAANRMSYLFNLRGPSVAVDTACSSSLVAVHLACQSLRTGESEMALAGGVNLVLQPHSLIGVSQLNMMALDGRCKTFDARADGFVRGEGCGVILLKPLSKAVADGDPIYAVIRGSASNQDGHSTGLTAPNGLSQQDVIREALRNADLTPDQISYVETHGTGTTLGDPIEVEALGQVYGHPRPEGQHCVLGAVKANVGHLEAAAGIAGLIKVILAFQHQTIPPQLHFQRLNPNISLHDTSLLIPTSPYPWSTESTPRRAGVSSFGVGGTNAHIILEEPPALPKPPSHTDTSGVPYILPISANDPVALRDLANRFHTHLTSLDSATLPAFCASASRRRTHHAQRLAVRGHTAQELCAHLEAFGHDQPADGLAHGQMPPAGPPTIVFVCPGQGSQWPGMARDLLAHDPVVAQVLTQVAQAFQPYVTWDLLTVLQTDPDPAAPWPIDVIQPTLFALTLALAARWQHWGITPSAYIGHSMGEVAAAYLAGALALDAAARIICRRSQLLRRVSGQGAMAVVDLPVAQAATAIAAYPTQLAVAVCNSPHSTVLAGDPTALDAVVAQLQQQNVFCRSIAVDVASHSPQMDPLRTDLLTALGDLQPQAGSVPLYSTVDAQVIDGAGCDAAYWVRNLREPVQFATAVQQALAAGHILFVELSPHPILLPAIATGQEAAGVTGALVASGQRDTASGPVLRAGLGVLYSQGCPVRWDAVYPEPSPYVPLPTYPWQRQRYWSDTIDSNTYTIKTGDSADPATQIDHPWLTRQLSAALPIFTAQISLERHPILSDHQIGGVSIVPASVYIELLLAAAQTHFDLPCTTVRDLMIHQALVLDAQTTWDIQVILSSDDPSATEFQIFGRPERDTDTTSAWSLYASGRIAARTNTAPALAAADQLAAAQQRCSQEQEADAFYTQMRQQGLEYGPTFQGISRIWCGDNEALAEIRLPEALHPESGACQVHPALLDACFQLLPAALSQSGADVMRHDLYLFALAEQLTVYAPAGSQVWCNLWLDAATAEQPAETLIGHLQLFNSAGQLILEIHGLCAKRTSRAALQRKLRAPNPWIYEVQWLPQLRQNPSTHARPIATGQPGSWLILTAGDPIGVALAEQLTDQGQHCVLLQPGESFDWLAEDTQLITAEVRPDHPDDWHQLVQELLKPDQPPCQGIIHCWGLPNVATSSEINSLANLDTAQTLGSGSVLLLVQALLSHSTTEMPPLWLVTQEAQPVDSEDAASVAHAPLWGLGRTLALEHPELWGGIIDLPTDTEPLTAATWIREEVTQADGEDQLAFRDEQRYVARLAQGRLPTQQHDVPINADATYLITGGLGGLGLRVAAWLVAQGAQHLVLLGRRGLPPRDTWVDQPAESAVAAQIAAVQELEDQGSTIQVCAADVSNYDQITALLAEIEQTMPPLRGILHTATAVTPQPLQTMDLESLHATLQSKVAGTWVLHELTTNHSLDFFVLFSSTSALLGAQHLGHYAAANSFLDSFAAYRRGLGLPAMSINWGTWETIRSVSQSEQEQFMQGGMRPMPDTEALEMLGMLLGSSAAQHVVANVDWTTLKPLYEARRQRPLLANLSIQSTREVERGTSMATTPELIRQLEDASPQTRCELLSLHVRNEVAAVLGFDQPDTLDVKQGFFQLGMDSIMAVMLRQRLETSLGQSLPTTLVFNYPTVSGLSEYLVQKLFPEAAAQPAESPVVVESEVEQLRDMAKRSQLSDDEVAALLDRIEQVERRINEPIAIIGMGCRFPGGAHDPETFWHLLSAGADLITPIPADRWDSSESAGMQWGAFVDEVDAFDAGFFGISPREAAHMDPQHRLFLEVAWEALERAGQPLEQLAESVTGVFVGIINNENLRLQIERVQAQNLDVYHLTGNSPNAIAGRLSYVLGLNGPSMAIDTACSASLVAIHLACQSLQSGACDRALAGGVNLILAPDLALPMIKAGMLAPDGHCKTFDAQADGFVRSEGVGVLVLKRLRDAQAAGDPILALIRSAAVNQDGASSGLTVPNGRAQQALLRQALRQAHLTPADVSYVEAHGTGTSLGDPIELEALSAVLGAPRPADSPLLVGSVKTNLGHLEGAAGVVGAIKTVLALQHEAIPPHLHFQTPSPHLDWTQTQLQVPTTLTPWPRTSGMPRRAGVSSFGLSGTNAHLIIEEAPLLSHSTNGRNGASINDQPILLPISARSPEALHAFARRYQTYLASDSFTPINDIGYTSSIRRSHHDYRLAIVGQSGSDISDHLGAFLNGEPCAQIVSGQVLPNRTPKIVFVCPGQGSQWPGMARDLLAHDPVVAQVLTQVAQAFQPYVTWDLLTVLQTDPDPAAPWPIDVIQPTLFALTLALAARWQHWGITPSAYIGHSMGEVAAAYLAGALTLDAAARIICRRSQLLRRVSGQGAMAVVDLPVAQAAAAIAAYPTQLAVAVCNSPHSTVLAGDPTALDAVVAQLQQQNVFCRPIAVDVASHSPQMDPLRNDLLAALGDLQPQAGSVPLYSTVDAQVIDGAGCDAAYWVRNLREPVQFATAVQQALVAGHTLFVELSPHPILLPAIMHGMAAAGETGQALPSLQREMPSQERLLMTLGALYGQGASVNWAALYPHGSYVPLPTYPWQHKHFPLEHVKQHRVTRESTQQPDQESIADLLYEVTWQLKPRPSTSYEQYSPGRWVICADTGGLGEQLGALLASRGEQVHMVWPNTEQPTDTFESITLDPTCPEAFQHLLEQLTRDTDLPLRGVVHLWSLMSSSTTTIPGHTLEESELLNIGSIPYLVRALASVSGATLPQLWVVTQGAQAINEEAEPLAVGQAPVWGLARTVALEHPELWGGIVDIASAEEGQAAELLLEEIWHPDGEEQIALRGDERYVARLVPARLRSSQGTITPLRSDSSYLVTGGLGGLGLRVARSLVENGARHIVLLGRSAFPERADWYTLPVDSDMGQRIAVIQELEALGADIHIIRADTGDITQMTAVFEDIDNSLPPLRGIIHAAGIGAEQPVINTTIEHLQHVFQAKVTGTLILHHLTKDRPLDFMVYFSSGAAVWGSAGVAAYAAANSFLDAMAYHQRSIGLPATSINWGRWEELRLAGGASEQFEELFSQIGLEVMPTSQALDSMHLLMADGPPQMTVAAVDWNRFKLVYEAKRRHMFLEHMAITDQPDEQAQPATNAFTQQLAQLPPAQRWSRIVAHIQTAAGNVLGLESPQLIAPDQGFFQLGMDSVMSVELQKSLEHSLGHTLPSTLVFDYPTVGALTRYLLTEVFELERDGSDPARPSNGATAQTNVQEIDDLSDEEAEALLQAELEAIGFSNHERIGNGR